ncbi:MAG: hypothetical protein QM785_03255 [Pyrinomonadaceae bacterium]
MKRIAKIVFCFAWILVLGVVLFGTRMFPVNGQTGSVPNTAKKPDSSVIDRFDAAMHKRFLTEPFFGMARIAPIGPQPLRSSHLGTFSPIDTEERSLQTALENDGWDVGLYLFGRVSTLKEEKPGSMPKFRVNYRLNEPVPITRNIKAKDLHKSSKLMKEVKSAFIEFQTPNSPRENNYEFAIGKWSYVARPVRAINESCLKCHTDYVITEKLPGGQFKFKKREIGDANGVIVYAFARIERGK